MDYAELKKRASETVKRRSLKPDIIFIFTAVLMVLSVICMPIAFTVVSEYRKYLRNCATECDRSKPVTEADKKREFEYTPPSKMELEYNFKSLPKLFKAFVIVAFPSSAMFYMPHLSEEQNIFVKSGLEQMKSHFIGAIMILPITVFLAIMAVVPYSALISLICALLIPVIIIFSFRSFVIYCQALVMYEKYCLETKYDDGEYKEEEDCDDDDVIMF